ncbi:MAG TPA: 4-(cytidine 5'-diphospho)-2-C-methyl-D-erythritol kinase [Allosphingosinicella sp.]|jgi:4-diphosphocytidyl-2-C-methyl-D-erythritol kinase
MEELARAKINLALHVRGREPDGYHRLETVFAFAEHGDLLRAREAAELSLRIEGPFAQGLSAGEDNLVLRAARALQARLQVGKGAALILDKRLPVASGIGGGSADAAAALRLLDRLWGIGAGEPELLEIGRSLGADVPACVLSRPCLGTGRGDDLAPYDASAVAGAPLLLVNPGVGVSTADIFRRWTARDGGPLPEDLWSARNDLEGPAMAVAPVIGDVLGALAAASGARLVRMSGSGATCFALFESAAARDVAAREIAAAQPRWWQLASRLG